MPANEEKKGVINGVQPKETSNEVEVVAMNLRKRIERLENLYGGRRCPTCGYDGHDYSTVNPPPLEEYDPEDREPKYCPTCGVQTRIVLTWD